MTVTKTPLETDLHIGPQISIEDLERLRMEGYRTIICLRPDHEEPGQPTAAELSERANALGLVFHHLPCSFDRIGPDEAATFKSMRSSGKSPVFAFCKSGMRAAGLWTIDRADKSTWQTALRQARELGFNMDVLHDRLIDLRSNH